jgi:hypothetical protein
MGPFPALFREALVDLADYRLTAIHALQIGVDPDEIIDYARGLRPLGFENLLVQSPWAMGRVTALVKAARRPASLGNKLLSSRGRTDPYAWGIKETGDRDLDLATLLDQVD